MLLFLPVLTGILLVASFPRANQGYLAWIAFVPLIAFVFRTGTRIRAFWGGFAAAAITLTCLLTWIPTLLSHYGGMSSVPAWMCYALMIVLLACYPATACLLAKHWLMRGGQSFLLLFPFSWILFEYLLSLSPFGGFPWLLAGYSQSSCISVIQIADITGVYGISFLILSVNTAIVWLCFRRNWRLQSWAPLVAAAVLVAACVLYGGVALHRWERITPGFRTAMLQANFSIDVPESALNEKYRIRYPQMADSLKSQSIDLLVLPEAPTPVLFQQDASYREDFEKLARRYPFGLVLNNINDRVVEGIERYSNSAFFLDGKGALAGIYDKMHLVPFGEYIPLRRVFFFAESVTKDVGDFYPGQDFTIVNIGIRPSNAIICFEAVFPALVRRFVDRGSQLIINLTNDEWYGDSAAPYQHLAITRLRAVENRRYLLRATNSGISALIEPTGRIQSKTGILREAICEGRFAFLTEKTFYARYGDVFVFLCAIISCGIWMFVEYGNFRKRKRENSEE